jgi:hypothetical protein
MKKQIAEDKPKDSAFVSLDGRGINWVHTIMLGTTPLIAFYGLVYIRPSLETLIFTFILYCWTGLGITSGLISSTHHSS